MRDFRDFYSRALDHDAVVHHFMKMTGLPKETVEGLDLTDEELDDLCETVLSDLPSIPERKRASGG